MKTEHDALQELDRMCRRFAVGVTNWLEANRRVTTPAFAAVWGAAAILPHALNGVGTAIAATRQPSRIIKPAMRAVPKH